MTTQTFETTRTIAKTRETWEHDAANAISRPVVKARSTCQQATIESGAFSWKADLPTALGGGNQAPSPTALLLSALAGCAVVFVRDTLAPQLGVRIDAVRATVSCVTDARGLLGIGEARANLEDVELTFEIESPDGEAAVGELIAVWKERCPVYLGFVNPTPVRVSYKVIDWYSPR